MLNQSTSERPWWEKPQYHPKQFWYQEHRNELLAQAQNERLIRQTVGCRGGAPNRMMASVADGLIAAGQWLKARAQPLRAG